MKDMHVSGETSKKDSDQSDKTHMKDRARQRLDNLSGRWPYFFILILIILV